LLYPPELLAHIQDEQDGICHICFLQTGPVIIAFISFFVKYKNTGPI
jgi:hypothetical protein